MFLLIRIRYFKAWRAGRKTLRGDNSGRKERMRAWRSNATEVDERNVNGQ